MTSMQDDVPFLFSLAKEKLDQKENKPQAAKKLVLPLIPAKAHRGGAARPLRCRPAPRGSRKPTARVPPPDAGRAEARPPVAPLILSFSRREKDRMRGISLVFTWMAFSPGEIKVVKRMAYGCRDDHDVFLRIRAAFPGNPG